MAKFRLSAFADEAGEALDTQIKALKDNRISLIELRNTEGRSCADLTRDDAAAVREKLDANGIAVSALGSPFGKIGILDDFAPHLEKFKYGLENCHVLNCGRIRMFSFYLPEEKDPADFRNEVIERLSVFLDLAEDAGIRLEHENEKGIYGDIDDRCLDLYQAFGGRLGMVFDPANYVQCHVDPWKAYEKQKAYTDYFHIKDAFFADGSVVSAGRGDGSVQRILDDIDRTREDTVILTVEPHLAVFPGLETLQKEELRQKEAYSTPEAAFRAASEALYGLLKNKEIIYD